MSSLCRNLSWLALLLSVCLPMLAERPLLRICTDPDNLPYSNRQLQGFDNKIASLLAKEMGRRPVFIWARPRRGFLREEFNKNTCDLLTGVPVGMKGVLTTRPYYRSTYVFVTRQQDGLAISSFDDPRLANRRIGLQIMEEDLSPPSLPLIRSGHAAQLVGYEAFGSAAGNVIRAVANRKIGLAVVWGPLAGYYTQNRPLRLTPVLPAVDPSGIPFVFDIAFGVHKRDAMLCDELNAAIERKANEIRHILHSYGVPLLSFERKGI